MSKIQIFMSTYNGAKYIVEQIESLLTQKNIDIVLQIRDDGSTDETVDILARYNEDERIKVRFENNRGYAKSFFSILQNVDRTCDYFAFSDQDDVWLENKVSEAVRCIEAVEDKTVPLLYVSALTRVNEKLEFLSLQDFPNLKLNLKGEFTRHRLAGCTFVFNQYLLDLMLKFNENLMNLVAHDELMTIVCIAHSKGRVLFDPRSFILFRRHGNNSSLDNASFIDKIKKDIRYYFTGKSNKSEVARVVLEELGGELDYQTIEHLKAIRDYKLNWFNTIRFASSAYIDCGYWYFNLFVRLMICMRKY